MVAPSTADKPAQTQEESILNRAIEETQRMMTQPEYIHLRMENDTMMAKAEARPRDFVKIRDELKQLVDEFPDFGRQAIYAKPCGKDPETGRQKIARGLSIRAAEAFAEIYGYNRIVTETTLVDDRHAKVTAVFTDFQRVRTWHDTGTVSREYKSREGKAVLHPEDRFLNVVVKAEASRRIREVVNRSINAALKAWFFDYCDEKAASLLTDKEIDKMLGTFAAEFSVTAEQIETYIGRRRSLKWTNEDRLMLLGVYNALREGETTVADAFGTVPATGARASRSPLTDTIKGNGPVEQQQRPQSPDAPQTGPSTADQYSFQLAEANDEGGVHAIIEAVQADATLSPADKDGLLAAAAKTITALKRGSQQQQSLV